MGLRTSISKEQQKLTDSILSKSYNKREQILSLYGHANEWVLIMKENNWAKLKQLDLGKCKIDDSGIQILADVQWNSLNFLQLSDNKFDVKGIKMLINSKFDHLKTLLLNSNNIGNIGVKWIIKINLPMIQMVGLRECKVEDEGAKHLSKNRWKILQQLLISYNEIKITGFQTMSSANMWPQLRRLWVGDYRTEAICYIPLAASKPKKAAISVWTHNKMNKTLNKLFQPHKIK